MPKARSPARPRHSRSPALRHFSVPVNHLATAGDGKACLTGTGTPAATSYNVMRSTVSGGFYTTLDNVMTQGLVNTGMTNGRSCHYVVTALNEGGKSGMSA